MEETGELSRETLWRGFKIAASRETVYVGKRDGHLFQSLDGGDTWNDITSNLPLPVEQFNQIVFADANGSCRDQQRGFQFKRWGRLECNHRLEAGESVIITSLATAEDAVYGANDDGIHHLEKETGTWKQIVPEIPDAITSLVVDGDTFYVGTEHRGVLHFERANQ